MPLEATKSRATQVLDIVNETCTALSNLEIPTSERSLVAIPLLCASVDAAGCLAHLLATRPDRTWVGALGLFRSQLDYVLRGAFFAKAANAPEIRRFSKKGKLPTRAIPGERKRVIYATELANEVCAACSLGSALVGMVKGHWASLSGVVHGGREVLAIYTKDGELGMCDPTNEDLAPILDNVVALTQLAIAVAMGLSSLSPQALSDAVEPAYEKAQQFYAPPSGALCSDFAPQSPTE